MVIVFAPSTVIPAPICIFLDPFSLLLIIRPLPRILVIISVDIGAKTVSHTFFIAALVVGGIMVNLSALPVHKACFPVPFVDLRCVSEVDFCAAALAFVLAPLA